MSEQNETQNEPAEKSNWRRLVGWAICVLLLVVLYQSVRVVQDFLHRREQIWLLDDFTNDLRRSRCMEPGGPFPLLSSECFRAFPIMHRDGVGTVVYSPVTYTGVRLQHSQGPDERFVVAWVEPAVAGETLVLLSNAGFDWVPTESFDRARQVVVTSEEKIQALVQQLEEREQRRLQMLGYE